MKRFCSSRNPRDRGIQSTRKKTKTHGGAGGDQSHGRNGAEEEKQDIKTEV